MNVINFNSKLMKRDGSEMHLYTLKEFKDLMNGDAFNDPRFEITLIPFRDPHDNYLEGYAISFIHGVSGQYCVVSTDESIAIHDFILHYKPIEKIFNILDSLKPCFRKISVHHENTFNS